MGTIRDKFKVYILINEKLLFKDGKLINITKSQWNIHKYVYTEKIQFKFIDDDDGDDLAPF